jgi:hypothetical protein
MRGPVDMRQGGTGIASLSLPVLSRAGLCRLRNKGGPEPRLDRDRDTAWSILIAAACCSMLQQAVRAVGPR